MPVCVVPDSESEKAQVLLSFVFNLSHGGAIASHVACFMMKAYVPCVRNPKLMLDDRHKKRCVACWLASILKGFVQLPEAFSYMCMREACSIRVPG